MFYQLCLVAILFFIYSFLGYIVEVLKVSHLKHHWVFSRGYLIGPYLPIFGMGSILMEFFLKPYQDDIIVLFVMGLTICCLLEYFTSLVLEKIFNLRWWDYSYKKYHINGRICLENSIYFGLGGVLLVRYFHPFLVSLLQTFSRRFIIILGVSLMLIILIDFIISTLTVFQIKNELTDLEEKDSTEQVKRKMKKIMEHYPFFHSRFFTAFPDVLKNFKYQMKKKKQDIQ